MDDPYLNLVYDHWENLLMVYRVFADQRPVMLFDVQEQKIYAYPYPEFKAELKPSSQEVLKDQYQRAQSRNQMVVFVRDNEARRLVSYALDMAGAPEE